MATVFAAFVNRYIGSAIFLENQYDSADDITNRKKAIEIDFLINSNNKISPIEVKSSVYKMHSSLDKFRNKFKANLGNAYILYSKDVMIKDDVIHLPIYMTSLL